LENKSKLLLDIVLKMTGLMINERTA